MKILSWDIGIKNLSYCILEKTEERIQILDWDIIDISNNLDIKKDKYRIFENISPTLDKYKLLDVDTVLIENQPCLKNPTMKTIQVIVYSYFLINGFHNKSSNISNILFISARNKLKCYNGPEVICKLKNKYSKRKFLAKEYTKYFIKDDPTYLEFFNSNKKKDDLADSYLQGLSYLLK